MDTARILSLPPRTMNERIKRLITNGQDSERGFHIVADYAPVMLWLADAKGSRSFFNRFWLDFTGCSPEQGLGSAWETGVHSEDLGRYRKAYRKVFTEPDSFQVEYRLRRADGEYRWILENGAPIQEEDGSLQGFIGSGIDITERKQSEQAALLNQEHIATLNSRLREAMKETHHRVKNSLQMIAAMIDLRLIEATPLVPADELRQLGLHINSLAVVHELLTEQARQDGLGDYLSAKDLLERLLPVLEALAGQRRLHFDISDMRLSARQANALPLVTNELVGNALKHGAGDVSVTLHLAGHEAILEVTDEGSGFPQGFDPRIRARTGLELVERLSRWDLSGSVRYENCASGGAHIILSLPLDSFH